MSAPTFLSLLNTQTYSAVGTTVPDGSITTISGNKPVWGTTFPSPLSYSTLTGSSMVTGALSVTSTKLALGQSTNQTAGANLSSGSYSNWITAKTGMTNVRKIAVSATGQYQLLVVAGALWLSSDSGQTWVQPTAYGLPSGANYTYSTGSISADGIYITIGVQGDLLYVSADSGATFNNPQAGVSPYAWLRLENNTTDTMGNSTVTTSGVPTFSSTVVPHSASTHSLRLTNTAGTGASQYITGTWNGSTNFTVSFWFNPQTLNGTYQYLFSAYSTYLTIFISQNNTLSAIVPSNGGTNYINIGGESVVLATNTWYYTTLIFQTNGLCSLYLNNTLVSSVFNSQGVGSLSTSGFELCSAAYAFNGFIDDFRITNSAITYQAVPIAPYSWLKFENSLTDTMGTTSPSVQGSTATVSYVPGMVGQSAINIPNTAGNTATTYISGSFVPPSSFTVSFWFNPQSLGVQQTLFGTGSNGWSIYLQSSNVLSIYRSTIGVVVTTPFMVARNTWYHVSAIFNANGTGQLYVNQSLIGSFSCGVALTSSGTFRLATDDVTGTLAFNGYIDDFRIYTGSVVPTGTVLTTNQNWSQVALSGSGQYQLAGTERGQVYQSNDYGRTWFASIGAYGAGSAGYMKNLALSHTGQYMIASAQKWVTPNQSGITGTTWSQSDANWIASSSSNYSSSYPEYAAFDITLGSTGWASAAKYNTTTGLATVAGATSTTVLGGVGAVLGEWIQLTSHVPLTLYSYNFSSGGNATQVPATYYIVGSNDGTNWFPIQYAVMSVNAFTAINTNASTYLLANYTGTQTMRANQTGSGTFTSYPTSTGAYTSFRLIIPAIWPSNLGSVQLGEWYPNFLATNTYTPQQTGLTTTTWSVNGVIYTVSSSSNYAGSNFAYNAFNNSVTGSTWGSALLYNTSTGAYTTGTSTFIQLGVGLVAGEWIQLQTSQPMTLTSYSAGCWGINTFPKTYYIVGSTDGTTWYPVQYVAYTTIPFTTTFSASSTILVNLTGTQTVVGNQAGSAVTTAYSTSTNSYTYFRFVITSLWASSTGVAELSELYLNFLGGQSYSTNYGGTWSVVPSVAYPGTLTLSSSGQSILGTNHLPVYSRMTFDGLSTDRMGNLTLSGTSGSVPYSTTVFKTGTAAIRVANTAGSTSPINYLSYSLPSGLANPPTLSISCWIYPTSFSGSYMAAAVGLNNGGSSVGPAIYVTSGGLPSAIVYTPSPTAGLGLSSPSAIALNQWHHIAFTYTSGLFLLYVNGVCVTSTTAVSGNLSNISAGALTSMTVGCAAPAWGAFDGYVDDLRMYTYVISPDQVQLLYNSPNYQAVGTTTSYLSSFSPSAMPILTGLSVPVVDAASNYTGQYMVVVTASTSGNNVWYSTNYGVTWTGITVAVTSSLVSCAMSYDGSYLTVSTRTSGYTLNNNGSGFTLALGAQAGAVSQGANAIAIGNQAGLTNQTASSIVINATGAAITTTQSGFYVAPVAAATSAASGTISLLGYGEDKQVVQTGLSVWPTGQARPLTIRGSYSSGYGVESVLTLRNEANSWIKFIPSLGQGAYLPRAQTGDFGIINMDANNNIGVPTAGIILGGWDQTASLRIGTNTVTMFGNVGIGTANPTYRFDVVGENNGGLFRIRGPTNGSNGFDQAIIMYTSDNGGPYTSYGVIQAAYEGSAYNYLSINPLGGHVGIGTTNPSTKLWIAPGISSTTLEGTSQWGGIHLQPIGTGDSITGITFGANEGGFGAERQSQAGIICQSSGAYGTKLYFQTCNSYANGARNRMMIDHAGNVGIGIINPGYALHVIGTIYASGNITAFSDKRFKSNVEPLETPLDKIGRLQGVSYHRTDRETDVKHIGLLAQDVNEVYPEAVSYDSVNDRYSLNYMVLVAPLIEAVKELRATVSAQAEEIRELKAEIRERLGWQI